MARNTVDDPSLTAMATFNMTPMIDVTFQLIVVFLCSMKFRTLDQKIEARLPGPGMSPNCEPRHVDLRPVLGARLQRAAPGAPTRLVLQGELLGTTDEGEGLWRRFQASVAGIRSKAPDLQGEIDASPEVDHGDVVRALDGFVGAGVSTVKFRGTKPAHAR